MEFKYLCFFALLSISGYASAFTETILDERQVVAYEQDLLGTSHSIAKAWWDTLVECHVVFPNGAIYQAYPVNNLPDGNVQFLTAAQPFTACGIGIRPVTAALSGTYELYSYVESGTDQSLSLTRQLFTLTVRPVDWRSGKLE